MCHWKFIKSVPPLFFYNPGLVKTASLIVDIRLSDSVTPEPCTWNVVQAGTCLEFPENSLESTTQLKLFLWSHEKRAPPLLEGEALVSPVVEVAPVGTGGGTEFKELVKLVLSHGAPDHKGYEVVVKQLEGESGFWEDLDTTDIRSSSGNFSCIIYRLC